jgi:protein-disulfide isomerase
MAKQTRAQREEARRRLDEERARQKAAERRRQILGIGVVAVVVALLVGAVAWGIASQDDESNPDAARPAAVTEVGGGLPFGASAADAEAQGLPTVDVYTDFMCPACRSFEDAAGAELEALADEGLARVVYHPVNLIGSNTGTNGSTRTGGAAGCVTDVDDAAFWGFRDAAFAGQPEDESVDIDDAQLVAWGEEAGLAGADLETFTTCATSDTYVDWVKQEWSAAKDRGVNSTPTVFVGGRELPRDELNAEGVRAAVESAS